MPRAQKPAAPRHDPLHVQLRDDAVAAKYGRLSAPGKCAKRRAADAQDEDADAEEVLDPKTSQRIFALAKDQQDELAEPDEDEVLPAASASARSISAGSDPDAAESSSALSGDQLASAGTEPVM